MGGGKETNTSNVQDTSTKVSTTNTITTGDIGLTGNDAVEFVKAIETGQANILQKVGDLAVPLVGGASALVTAASNIAQANAAKESKSSDISKIIKDNGWIIAAAIAGVVALKVMK